MSVVTMGVRASTAADRDRVVTLSDPRERRYVELVARGDTLVGVTCVGAPELAAHLSTQFDRPGMLPARPDAPADGQWVDGRRRERLADHDARRHDGVPVQRGDQGRPRPRVGRRRHDGRGARQRDARDDRLRRMQDAGRAASSTGSRRAIRRRSHSRTPQRVRQPFRRGNTETAVPKSALPTVEHMTEKKKLAVVGAGMVAHRLVEAMVERGADEAWDIEVFGDETRPPYDRVALTSFFSDRDPDDLLLGDGELWKRPGVRLYRGSIVSRIDREAKQIHARNTTFDVRPRSCWRPARTPPCLRSRAPICRAASSIARSTTSPSSAPG